jgi:hypothetical protein
MHPESAAAQLGLTPEEAEEVHEECICAQEEIQEEMDREDRIARERRNGQYGHEASNTANDADAYAVLFERNGEYGGKADRTELERDAIEPLAYELIVPGERGRDWAEEMDNRVGLTTQGEYIHTSYSQQPTPPPPAPWYPPQPHTSRHTRQQTHHLPPYRWYNPQSPATRPDALRSIPKPTPRRNDALVSKTEPVT